MKNDGVHLNGSLIDRKGFYIINKNGIINKYLLVGDTYVPEIHLKKPATQGKPRYA